VALGRIVGRLYLVDAEGFVIDEHGPQYSEFDLPIVDGLASAPEDGGPIVDPLRAQLMARLLKAVSVRQALSRRISQVDVRDARDAVVILNDDPAQIHVGDDQFAERLDAYLDLAPALRARVPAIDYVDLRFDQRIYVRPSGTTGRVDVRRGAAPAERQP
jgi:cell division septal protein FtsQ